MRLVANYEIKSDLSICQDRQWLKLAAPHGAFHARLRNIPRDDRTTPFLMSCHVSFEASSIEDAKDVADTKLADCLNMLAFVTGGTFVRHRIRQIVDCSDSGPMRTCLIWTDSSGHDDPQPFLDPAIGNTINRLLEFDAPPFLQRALRWYRLGISAESPDDQFQYFWFALELVAIAQESADEVPSKCPACRSPLYCETCEKHPTHRPFEKQKIRHLIERIETDNPAATFALLSKARNRLMHGGTLRELERSSDIAREDVVDSLGRIVFKALINQFPREKLGQDTPFGSPSTYVHRTLTAVAHVQTVVPQDEEGEFDLTFTGLKVSLVDDTPPQSARPSIGAVTHEQFSRLRKIADQPGDDQIRAKRIVGRAKAEESRVVIMIPATDMDYVRDAVASGKQNPFVDLFKELLPRETNSPEAE